MEACPVVPPDCGNLCEFENLACYTKGPGNPDAGVELCSDDLAKVEIFSSYPIWCCRTCTRGTGNCAGDEVIIGAPIHEASCPDKADKIGEREVGSRTCGLGKCQVQEECNASDMPPTCVPLDADPFEDCFNGDDDDCDGMPDCDDPDCWEPPEICFDGVDDNCDPSDDNDPYLCFDPDDDPPENGEDEDGKGGPDNPRDPGKCDDCRACLGAPVHLRTRQLFVGPQEDFRVKSDNGGSFDLVFARVYDSDRAARDQLDDVRPGDAAQHPFPRPFGPGWRHSFDDRLILRGDGAPEEPLSVLYDHAMGHVRLFPTGPGSFGRVPGRALTLQRDGATWRLTLENGDVLDFEESDVATTNHPRGARNPAEPEQGPQYHLRLSAIHPMGVPGYRIRVWHEQDSGIPAGACEQMPGGACNATRGLLVAVAVELLHDGAWYRGASFHFRWTSIEANEGSNERDQLLLAGIVDGVDVDAGEGTPTTLVQFLPSVLPGSTWRRAVHAVRSGLGGQLFSPGALSYRLAYDPSAPWLLTSVKRAAVGTNGAIVEVPVEEFEWEPLIDGGFGVGVHRSRGIELSASQQPLGPAGPMSWTNNGHELTMRFERGRPVECVTGDCGAVGKPRTLQRSIDNNRYLLGAAKTPRPDGTFTLREIDEQGHVVLEADVLPSTGVEPTMTRTIEGDSEEVTFAGVARVDRVARSYTTAEEVSRTVAVAARSAFQVSAAIRFPSEAGVPESWRYQGAASMRRAVTNHVVLAGEDHYFDVDVSDTDTDGDEILNEVGEKLVVWMHRTRTDHNGAIVYRSTRDQRSPAGQLIERRTLATPRGADAPVLLIGRTAYFYFKPDAEPAARGRRAEELVFPNARSGAGAFLQWHACGASEVEPGDRVFERDGTLVCRRENITEDLSAPVIRRERLTVDANGVQRTLREVVPFHRPPILSTFEERLASGFVSAAGTVGGNSTAWRVGAGALATQALQPSEVRHLDANGGALRTDVSSYTPEGLLSVTRSFELNLSSLDRRLTDYHYDDEGRVAEQTTYARPTTHTMPSTTLTHYDQDTDQLQTVTEPDGTVVKNIYVDGRLSEVQRDGNVVAGYSYDDQGRVTEVKNATTLVLRITYGEGDDVAREENLAAGFVVEHEEDIAIVGSDAYRVVRTTHKSPAPASVVRRDIDTFYDNLGRVTMICDATKVPLCGEPLAEYTYDSKGGFAGVLTVASGRTVDLSSSYDQGRLAYVTHPAGATFFVYDALGRIVTKVQHEGAMPPSPPATGSAMRAIDYRYAADGTLSSIMYPSNRRVDYVYGADKRAPESVHVALATSRPQTTFELLRDVRVDVAGNVYAWFWTASGQTGHRTIVRDGLGRATTMGASHPAGVDLSLNYTYDEDGDVLTQTDYSFVSSLPGGVTAVEHRTHPFRDLLTSWRAFTPWLASVASDVDLVDVDELGRRRRVTSRASPPAVPFDVSFEYDAQWPERLVELRRNAPSPAGSVATFGYDDLGQVNSTVYYGPIQAQMVAYGPRGNVVETTNASGTTDHFYADTMERWRRVGPVVGLEQRFRYGIGGELLDDEQQRVAHAPADRAAPRGGPAVPGAPPGASRGRSVRDEFVYLGGMKVAAIHSETRLPNPEVALLFTDRLGTVRKMTTLRMDPIAQIDTDAWGNGRTRDERVSPNIAQIPNVGERLPGQYSDGNVTFGALENHWRFYSPWAGGYLSPDPEYRAGASAGVGPQSFAYASGRPLLNTDPDGLFISGDPLSMSVIAGLSGRSGISSAIATLRSDKHINVTVRNVPATDPDLIGGGYTNGTGATQAVYNGPCSSRSGSHGSEAGKCDAPDEVIVKWNQSSADAAYSALGLSGGASKIVGHELGHVFYFDYCRFTGASFQPPVSPGGPYDPSSNGTALWTENCTRAAPNYRFVH